MFGVTGGYHRYFSHRTYKTSRWFQFILAFLAQSTSQKGALWWAAHHRTHHKESDTVNDVHSPVRQGLFYSHIGWLYQLHNDETDYNKISDFAKYPELVFLNKNWLIPPILLGTAVWLWLGWSGLLIGFFFSTVLLWHGTFTINSLSHVFGYQDYYTGDHSRNNWFLALITLGEGWHNNHHFYQSCARQGFKWWQYDVTYYILKVMSWVGLIWDLREPPAEIVAAAGTHIREALEAQVARSEVIAAPATLQD
jgi:stearoyl-CoA desaturase (delta-9 desaturase)